MRILPEKENEAGSALLSTGIFNIFNPHPSARERWTKKVCVCTREPRSCGALSEWWGEWWALLCVWATQARFIDCRIYTRRARAREIERSVSFRSVPFRSVSFRFVSFRSNPNNFSSRADREREISRLCSYAVRLGSGYLSGLQLHGGEAFSYSFSTPRGTLRFSTSAFSLPSFLPSFFLMLSLPLPSLIRSSFNVSPRLFRYPLRFTRYFPLFADPGEEGNISPRKRENLTLLPILYARYRGWNRFRDARWPIECSAIPFSKRREVAVQLRFFRLPLRAYTIVHKYGDTLFRIGKDRWEIDEIIRYPIWSFRKNLFYRIYFWIIFQ